MRRSWREIDAERAALAREHSPRFSRAEFCRRAGISESTVTKGIKAGYVPIKSVSQQAELVLAAERSAIEGGLR